MRGYVEGAPLKVVDVSLCGDVREDDLAKPDLDKAGSGISKEPA